MNKELTLIKTVMGNYLNKIAELKTQRDEILQARQQGEAKFHTEVVYETINQKLTKYTNLYRSCVVILKDCVELDKEKT